MDNNVLLKLYNYSLVRCLLILSHFFSQANCCEEVKDQPIPSSYMLATGHAGAERLDRIHEIYSPLSPLESFLAPPENAKILSVGCGTGARECQLAQYWPHARITAIDNSEDQIVIARKRASDLGIINIDFIVEDANNLSDIDQYDWVYARLLLIHVKDPRSVLGRMIRAAKPGAPIICEEFSSSSSFCEPDNKYYKDALQLTQKVSETMGIDYDIGIKLDDIMTDLELTSVTLIRREADRSILNVKMQLQLAIAEAKSKLIETRFDEKTLDELLNGLEEFAKLETSRMSMSDLFQAVGYKPLRDCNGGAVKNHF